MKLYLSSYRLGNHVAELQKLVGESKARVAVSVNGVDNSPDLSRRQEMFKRELEDMKSLGFQAEELDLRDYFSKGDIARDMKRYDLVWFSGGNVFLLAKAFKQSGFTKVLKDLVVPGKLVYAGYSAAFCVLHDSLKGMELVDEQNPQAKGYNSEQIWEGAGLIDFYPIVHFRSDHPESDDVEKEYAYVLKNKIKHKTLRDGDVYVKNGQFEQLLS